MRRFCQLELAVVRFGPFHHTALSGHHLAQLLVCFFGISSFHHYHIVVDEARSRLLLAGFWYLREADAVEWVGDY
jgi:hypothetical protein